MSKSGGLGNRLLVAGVNLSGDTGSLSAIGGGIGTQEQTGIDKGGLERGALTRDGRINYSAWWNPDGAHVTLSALPTADQVVTWAHAATLGAQAASQVGKQIGYDPTRDANGAISGITVSSLANGYGLEWGRLLTAGVDQLTSGSPNGDGLDYGAAVGTTNFGLQAYLHVVAFDGTDVTLSIQDSDDDDAGGSGDAYTNVTGAVFAEVTTAPGSQRLQTDRDQAVKRWLRVAATTTAGFNSVDVLVMVRRNLKERLF